MDEILKCHTTDFDTHLIGDYQADTGLSSKQKALIHYERLKKRMGFETHSEHVRPYRDVPCLQRDLETALDSTEKVEITHMSLLARKITTELDSPDVKSTNASFLVCDGLTNKMINMKGGRKVNNNFPLNNKIFNELWEKIFVAKYPPYLAREENKKKLLKQNKKPSHPLKLPKVEDCIKSNVKISHYKLEQNLSDNTRIRSVSKCKNASSKQSRNLFQGPDVEKDLQIKRKLLSVLRQGLNANPAECELKIETKNLNSSVNLTESAYNEFYEGPKTRGRSHQNREFSPSLRAISDSESKYESNAKRYLLLRKKYYQAKQLEVS